MLETIYITRHANRPSVRADHKTGEYRCDWPSPTGIVTDPPLTSDGVAQSHELAKHLVAINPPVDRVYSSPMYRCLQTLKPTTSALFAQGKAQGKICVDHGLGEFYGKAWFKHPSPPTLDILKDHFDHLDLDYHGPFKPNEYGEMIQDLHERVARAIANVVQDLDNDPHGPKTLLICTHAATMICLGRALTGQIPDDPDTDDFQCYTASLSVFKRRDPKRRLGAWDCTLNADASYLSGGGVRGWHFNGEEDFVNFDDAATSLPAPERQEAAKEHKPSKL